VEKRDKGTGSSPATGREREGDSLQTVQQGDNPSFRPSSLSRRSTATTSDRRREDKEAVVGSEELTSSATMRRVSREGGRPLLLLSITVQEQEWEAYRAYLGLCRLSLPHQEGLLLPPPPLSVQHPPSAPPAPVPPHPPPQPPQPRKAKEKRNSQQRRQRRTGRLLGR
jgi:hypothetical protein